MAIASRQNTVLSIWHRPYSWLTAAAIISIVFNVLIIGGFLPTVRFLIDTYSSEVNRAAVVNISVFAQLALFVLPIVITVIGAILLFQKKRIGAYIVLTGLGIYLASSISSVPLQNCCNIFVRDPVELLVGYWYKPTFSEMHIFCGSCYVAQTATFYYFFLPTMLTTIALACVGWLKTRRFH